MDEPKDFAVDSVQRFNRPIERRAPDHAALEFVEGLFRQPGVGDSRRFPDGRRQNLFAEEIAE